MIRLNKYISECGIASRRKADELITEGRVTVNGKTVVSLGTKVSEDKDTVAIDGEALRIERKVYYLLNKPRSVITSTSDEKGRRTVVDLINTNAKIFPVGRLDYDTTGLLLLTNDGEFTNYLLHPKNKIQRVYSVLLDKPLDVSDKQKLLRGIFLDKKKSKFQSVNILDNKTFKRVKVITVEGRNHFVKNMFGILGYRVKKLERIKFGPFNIENLKRGSYIKLSKYDIDKLLNI